MSSFSCEEIPFFLGVLGPGLFFELNRSRPLVLVGRRLLLGLFMFAFLVNQEGIECFDRNLDRKAGFDGEVPPMPCAVMQSSAVLGGWQ